jgi:O-antigen/teichoic acid export membrane protein
MKMADNRRMAAMVILQKDRHLNSSGQPDMTGRDRMLWNVLASWAGQLVFLLAGFLMPRMIDTHVGQAALGIWDFSWSLASYFGLANLGVGSSVNRYVAMYRAANDISNLKAAVSSVLAFQFAAGAAVAGATILVVYGLPFFFVEKLGIETESARYVVAFLGASVAVQMFFDVFRGVMTGCHRWDLHNAVTSGYYLLSVIAMIGVLMAGHGLRGLAVVYFIGVVLTEITRCLLALRICPELAIGLRYVQLKKTREMIVFGLKGVMGGIPNLIVLQGTSLLIAGNLGPEALAVFSRPLALIRNLELFILKFAAVLTPTTGSLQSSGRLDDLAEMLITSTRTAAYLAMPILVFFSFSGDAILSIWMGLHYQPEMVLPILSIGLFFPLIRHSVMSILMGMDMHGKIGFMSLMLTSVSFALSALVVESTGWTLNAASLVVGIPLSLGMGVSVIIFGCLKLKVPLTHFLGQVIKVPVLCSVPYALSLMVCRKMFAGKPVLEVVAGFLCAVALLGPLYWRYVIPETARKKAVDFIDSTIHSPFS